MTPMPAGKTMAPFLTALLLVPLAAKADPAAADGLATFTERRQAILAAAMAQPEKLTGGAPMHFWIAQQLFAEFPGAASAEQLAAFRAAVRSASRIALTSGVAPTGVYTGRDGAVIARTFNGDSKINGERVPYETWPLLENPWMRQEWEGNLTVTDGNTTRLYDVTNWTITESSKE